MGTKPQLPEGEKLEEIARYAAVFGLRAGFSLGKSVSWQTVVRWGQQAKNGVEPYRSWVRRFDAAYAAAKARVDRASGKLPPEDIHGGVG
jgi:hypothetical protein